MIQSHVDVSLSHKPLYLHRFTLCRIETSELLGKSHKVLD